MADHYAELTTGEKAHWDEYTRLRELSDWPGFSAEQDGRRADSRAWLEARRKELWHLIRDDPEKNQAQDRHERYDQLQDDKLNGGGCRRVASLPRAGCTNTEKVLIPERCMWWMVDSSTDAQKVRKQACSDALIARRKELWHLMKDDPGRNKLCKRQQRYDNLCIATRYGSAYDEWCKTHDPETGKSTGAAAAGKKSARAQAVANARSFLGVSEKPSGSNKGQPQPSNWQKRVYGDDGVPWCACFVTCMAWDVGVEGASSAAVTLIVSLAQRGEGIFRGYTTDPSRVRMADFAVVSCRTCHIGLVADDNDPYHLVEGNTSPGMEGSQFNGGCVAEKNRPKHQVIGWALVDYPD